MTEAAKIEERYKRGLGKLITENPQEWLNLKKQGKISDGSVDFETFLALVDLGKQCE